MLDIKIVNVVLHLLVKTSTGLSDKICVKKDYWNL